MKKFISLVLMTLVLIGSMSLAPLNAKAAGTRGQITGKTVVGGLLSLLIWPGIGQAMNDQKGNKVATHAVVGLLPPFRFWSGYDALYNRQGGYWNGKV